MKLQTWSKLEEEPDCTMARFLRDHDPSIAKKVELQPY